MDVQQASELVKATILGRKNSLIWYLEVLWCRSGKQVPPGKESGAAARKTSELSRCISKATPSLHSHTACTRAKVTFISNEHNQHNYTDSKTLIAETQGQLTPKIAQVHKVYLERFLLQASAASDYKLG